jgi:Xaa-Pro aminopeptidase
MGEIRPGVKVSDIGELAFKTLLEGLVNLGLIKGDVNEMLKKNIHYSFMPHSLGHYIGFKTHDVGLQISKDKLKNKDPVKDKEDFKKYDASGSAILEEGMVTTVEPGIYFIQILINKAKNNEETKHFYDFEKIEEYMEVGGVRIEDDVLVTQSGFECLTKV